MTQVNSAAPTDTLFTVQLKPGEAQVDAPQAQPLLLSIEQGGVDWPSSCRNGTCRTCLGQLLQGQVRYEIEWPGLSSEEKALGYVLPCVAYPCSNLVLSEELE